MFIKILIIIYYDISIFIHLFKKKKKIKITILIIDILIINDSRFYLFKIYCISISKILFILSIDINEWFNRIKYFIKKKF